MTEHTITLEELLKPDYQTVDVLARYLHLSPRGIQDMCKKGRIGSSRPGRAYLIPRESIEEYLKIRR